MSTLYELTNDMKAILEMMNDPDISEEAIINTLDFVDGEFKDKFDGYGKVIRTIEGLAEMEAKEAERLSNRSKSKIAKVKAMKVRLQEAMIETDQRKIETALFTFAVQRNAPSLAIESEEHIPHEYFAVQEPKLDKRELMSAVKNGLEVKGVSIVQGESLRIR